MLNIISHDNSQFSYSFIPCVIIFSGSSKTWCHRQIQKGREGKKQYEPKQHIQGSHVQNPIASQDNLLLSWAYIQEPLLDCSCHPPGMSPVHILSMPQAMPNNTTSTILEFAAKWKTITSWKIGWSLKIILAFFQGS